MTEYTIEEYQDFTDKIVEKVYRKIWSIGNEDIDPNDPDAIKDFIFPIEYEDLRIEKEMFELMESLGDSLNKIFIKSREQEHFDFVDKFNTREQIISFINNRQENIIKRVILLRIITTEFGC